MTSQSRIRLRRKKGPNVTKLKHRPTKHVPRRKRRLNMTRRPYVLVPRTQMRAKSPDMVANPEVLFTPTLTNDPKKALRYKDRSGPFQLLQRHPELKKHYWYRRIDRETKSRAN